VNTEKKVYQISIEDIIPNRFQPRLAFDDESLKELADSIKQHGIIQPLVLRRLGNKFEIIAGERRFKAALMANLTQVPGIITELDDNASAEVAIVENIQRKDLTAIEEARSYEMLLNRGYMTQEELAKKMGISQSAISNKLRLLTLEDDVQKAVLHEKISERHARSLLKIKDSDNQIKMLNRIIKERLTVKQLEEEIKKMNNNQSSEIPKINSQPDIISILNNAIDINPIKENSEEVKTVPATENVTDPTKLFSKAETLPNKFFNFLEDEAANMTFEEKPLFVEPKNNEIESIFEVNMPKNEPTFEEVELLDFPEVFEETLLNEQPKIIIEEQESKIEDDYIDNTIKKIRDLDLQSERISIEEINLPNEYLITIKIKKD